MYGMVKEHIRATEGIANIIECVLNVVRGVGCAAVMGTDDGFDEGL
jgi:hypothetical protein